MLITLINGIRIEKNPAFGCLPMGSGVPPPKKNAGLLGYLQIVAMSVEND